MDHVGWLSLGFCAYFHQNVLLVQGKRLPPKIVFFFVVACAVGVAVFCCLLQVAFFNFYSENQ